MNVKRIKSATLFSNGNILIRDENGNEIPELSEYSLETHKRILKPLMVP